MAKEKDTGEKVKKPIYKKWWFWVIIVLIVFGAFGGGSKKTATEETAEPTEQTEETKTEEKADVITLTAGEAGEYGKEITMNEGTDSPETLIVYYLPAGDYTVKNVGEYVTQVSVYSGFHRDETTGYDDYDDVGDTPRIEVNETADINVPDGWFIEIHEPTKIELTAK